VKSELKAVLDSWVRYEQQQREAEQTALVQSVRESVEAELNKPAFRRQLLEEALTQVERESWFHIAFTNGVLMVSRPVEKQGDLRHAERFRWKVEIVA